MYQAGKQQKQQTTLSWNWRNAASVGATALATLLSVGCGNTYRPVVSAINPVGPAGQPTKYAVAISNPGANELGLLTFVDFSGDTTLSTPSIFSSPSYFAQTSTGTEGYVINSSGLLSDFGESNPTGLLTTNIPQTTLPAGAGPVNVSVISVGGTGDTIFVPEATTNKIAELNNSGPALIQELSVDPNPVYVVGVDGAPRVYAISQNTSGNGDVAAIEATTLSTSATIAVGQTPVYGVMSTDGRRAFIVNKGSGNVSVLNVVNNAPDTTPLIPATGTLGANPVWADVNPLTNQLVVLNAGNGTTAGSLSIINVPLCTATTQTTNPNCDTNNPVDAQGFGTVVQTVPVGINPTMVSVLRDSTDPRAYVVNQKDSTGLCTTGEGSVTVVSLATDAVEATICATSNATSIATADGAPTLIYGHPNNVAATTGSPTGKVYITSPDSLYMTVLFTDEDSVDTHITLQGYGIGLPSSCVVANAATCLPSATQAQPVGLRVTAP